MSAQKTELNRILEIIYKIAKKDTDGNYIYRGEPECYPRVSSNLYRELEKIKLLHPDVVIDGIETAEKEELKNAKKYTKAAREFEILTEIQHFGGKTNLIDFTTDYLIALFFACDRFPVEDGRIILQDKTGAIKDWIRKPKNPDPESRIRVQKSVFVRPPEGFIEPDLEIVIPKVLKQPLLQYLKKEFGISGEKIYPDLHGFVSNQDIRFSAYMDFFKGFEYLKSGIKAKNPEGRDENFQKAVNHFNETIKLTPEFTDPYRCRGVAYTLKGEVEKAIADFTKAIDLKPNDAEAYRNRGAAYTLKGEVEKTIADFTKAIEFEPNDVEAYRNRGAAYTLKGEYDAAIKDCTKAIDLKPDYAGAYNNRGAAYTLKGEYDTAVEDCTKAIEFEPDDVEAYRNRGAAYHNIGKVEEAIRDYNTVIGLKPQPAHVYYNRGEAWLHLREWVKAKADLITAKDKGLDIVAAFRNDYRDVATFERKHQVKLPKDIVALVRQGFRHRYPMVEKALDADGKPLESPEVLDLLKRFRDAGPPLGEYIKEPSYFGIETVPTEVFVVDGKIRDKLIAEHAASADILKPFLQGPDIRRWHVEPQGQWLISTHRGIEINAYPAILKYLKKYKELLSKREAEQEWYELQFSLDEAERFAQPKLVCPDLYNTQTFAVETDGFYCGYTCYVIPTDEKWLCGLLNTLPAEWFYSQVSKQLDGGKLEARSEYIKQIPVPDINTTQKYLVCKLVDYLIYLQQQPTTNSKDLAHARDSVMVGYFEWILKGLIYEFYMPDLLQNANRDIFKHLMAEELPEVDEIQGDKMSVFRSLYEHLHHREHPVRVNTFFQDGLRPIRIIEDKW